MKTLLFLLCFFCMPAFADAWLTVPLATHHVERHQADGSNWNERNVGVGLEFGTGSESPHLIAGTYRNSYYRDSRYLGAKWEPVHLGPFGIGATAVYATGYDRPYAGGLLASATDSAGNGLVLIFAPKAGSATSAFFHLEARLRLR